MLCRMVIPLMFLAIFLGCGKGEKQTIEEEYREFERKREIAKVGFDMDLLKKALQHYPKFRKDGFGKEFNVTKFRQLSRETNMDSMELLPIFMMIKEIEDSSKTATGNEFLKKKYHPRVIYLVKEELGIK